jgi:hypothetical protein
MGAVRSDLFLSRKYNTVPTLGDRDELHTVYESYYSLYTVGKESNYLVVTRYDVYLCFTLA